MIFNVSSGVTPFNYSVRASAAAPSGTGKPNEIAIITEVAVKDVQLNCVSAPTTRSNGAALAAGDVYIGFAGAAAARFNALKKNAIYIYPCFAYQYSGSAWVHKDAYIYQDGSWSLLSDLPAPSTPLADCTWAQIMAVEREGLLTDYFCVGDEKPVTLSTGEVVTLQIIGFNHDNLAAGGKAPITFGFKNCLNTKQKMNPTSTNVGGYSGCALYPTINNAIYNSLPADLRAVMKSVSKRTSAGNQSSSIVTTQNKLFLFSEVEVFGSVTRSVAGEGTQYAFFTNGGSRVKRSGGTTCIWWERSPLLVDAESFCYVKADGTAHGGGALGTYGVALGLCV